MQEINLSSISSTTNIIEGSERANILLPRGTKLCVDNALYSSKNNRNLLSFKDIHLNGTILKNTMKEILNIFISRDLTWIKNVYQKTY